MAKTPDVTIVGAGLAGSLLATMLAQRGHSVVLFEKRADMRRKTTDAGRSINLALAERGIHALKRAGVFDEVAKELVPMRGRMLHSVTGETWMQSYGWRDNERIYSVSRANLNKILLSAAESHDHVTIEFETPGLDVQLDQKILLVGKAESPQPVSYLRLIGSDGAGSPVRHALASQTNSHFTSEFLDHSYKELCIPAASDGSHQLPKDALHIWPRGGFMLIALPNADGSFTLTLFLANEGSHSFAQLDSPSRVEQFFQQHFPDAFALIPQLAEDFFGNPTGGLGTVRCTGWAHQDNVLLIGDAAHAVVPFHGQGMNCAFEDCAMLAQLLDTSSDWQAVFAQFDSTRPSDANAIADMAIENYLVMRDSVRDDKFRLRKQLEFELERRFPDRFIPRYSMVMFHRIPYRQAQRRGSIQARLLDQLLEDAGTLEQIDFEYATERIMAELVPVVADEGICTASTEKDGPVT